MTIKPNELYFNISRGEIEGTVDADYLPADDKVYLQAEDGELVDLYGEVFVNKHGEIDLISVQASNGNKHVEVFLDQESIEYITNTFTESVSYNSYNDGDYYDTDDY